MTYVNLAGVIKYGVLFPIFGGIAAALHFMLRPKQKK